MTETTGRNRYYHCDMLVRAIAGRQKHGDTRAAVHIDDAEAQILRELLRREMSAIALIAPDAVPSGTIAWEGPFCHIPSRPEWPPLAE